MLTTVVLSTLLAAALLVAVEAQKPWAYKKKWWRQVEVDGEEWMCMEAEAPLIKKIKKGPPYKCRSNRQPPSHWVVEKDNQDKFKWSGCGYLKWTQENIYARNKLADEHRLTFTYPVAESGVYQVMLFGNRYQGDCDVKNVDHGEQRAMRAEYEARGDCIHFTDEANDAWISVPDGTASAAPWQDTWFKIMLSCKWTGEVCSDDRLNINHKMYKATYQLEAGDRKIIISGRSIGNGFDKICLRKE